MDEKRLHTALRVISIVTTVAYLSMFFLKLWSRSRMLHETGVDIDWAVPATPQSMIALCLVTATLALVFLHLGGRVVAALLLVTVVFFYGQWAMLTNSIRANIGPGDIPGEGVIGNVLIGANLLDVFVIAAVLAMLAVSAVAFWKGRQVVTDGQPHLKGA